MKLLKVLLAVALAFLVNLAIAEPSRAERPILTNSPDYTEVTQALNTLLKAQAAPEQSGYSAEEIQQKLGDLRLQKYILETTRGWGRCRNQTGRTLAVYAHKPEDSSLFNTAQSRLFYLGNGQITDNEWSCDGIYLPSGVKVAGLKFGDAQGQELAEPVALKLVTGTQVIATTNPATGAVELNVAPGKVVKTGETTWTIPTFSQAEIDAQIPNAPLD